MLDHDAGDLLAYAVIDFGCFRHDEGRDVQCHDLVADQLVDQRFGEEDTFGVGVEASSSALTSSGVRDSEADVKPRRSANNTPISRGMPPGGASSTHVEQRFGFFLLARLDQGDALVPQPVDMAELIDEVISESRTLEPGRRIETHLPDDAVLVDGDPERLRRILHNLLANVREHAGADAAVTISLATSDKDLMLVVADTGPGMSTEDAARFFDRFWQAKPTEQHPRRGSGLGLAIVGDLVTAHGGTVALDTAPGQGTRFAITLPLSETETPVSASRRPGPKPAQAGPA